MVDIGALDRMGQHPVAVFREIEVGKNVGKTEALIARGFNTSEAIPGWPVDPYRFIQTRVQSWVASSVTVTVHRAGG